MARCQLGNTILVITSIILVTASASSFDGYLLMAVTPRTMEHMALLTNLESQYTELDFWQRPRVNVTSRILVPLSLLSTFRDKMQERNLAFRVASSDITSLVEASYAKVDPKVSPFLQNLETRDDFYQEYHDYDEIEKFLANLQTQHPDNIALSYLNYQTHENRQVILAKVNGSTGNSKPVILVEAGIHAREWISPAANLYVIEKLLQGYQLGSEPARSMLDTYDWYFVPVANPDGYVYSHSHSSRRMWRKNRKKIDHTCVGVDLNRNFDIKHGTTGVSFNCQSNSYPSYEPFTEPETANLRDLFMSLKDRLVSYLSIHSYSQFLLVPWGYTEYIHRPGNGKELDRVATLMSRAIESTSGKSYLVGTAYELLQYAASGASEDWALTAKPDIYALCYELRPDFHSDVAFLLPPEEIVATGQEYMASLEVLAREMRL